MPTDDRDFERLRSLVGPSEISYEQVSADLAAVAGELRDAELAAGALRGELAEMSVQLARARQDQDTMQRRRDMGAVEYLVDLAREYRNEVMRPAAGRVVRRLGFRRRP